MTLDLRSGIVLVDLPREAEAREVREERARNTRRALRGALVHEHDEHGRQRADALLTLRTNGLAVRIRQQVEYLRRRRWLGRCFGLLKAF